MHPSPHLSKFEQGSAIGKRQKLHEIMIKKCDGTRSAQIRVLALEQSSLWGAKRQGHDYHQPMLFYPLLNIKEV